MNTLTEILENIRKKMPGYTSTLARHRFIVMIIIACGAITIALLRTQSYIDVPRNEATYTEGVIQINYEAIDEEILDDFSAALADETIEVNSNFDPNRKNPFTE